MKKLMYPSLLAMCLFLPDFGHNTLCRVSDTIVSFWGSKETQLLIAGMIEVIREE